MKLASLKDHTKDGKLVVVSKDLSKAVFVSHIATTLQQVLDSWADCKNELIEIYNKLNNNDIENIIPFGKQTLASPLPRAYQWADGSAYVNHIELVRKARGAEMPENFWHDPLMYQGGSDNFLGPYDDIPLIDEQWGLDFEAELAVITTDVEIGTDKKAAEKSIALLMLVNDISLRHLIPSEIAKGFGFFQSKPASAFSPVAVTPDELGNAWDGKKLHLPLLSFLNGKLFGQPNAGIDMTFDFPSLIAHAAKTRHLVAGSIIGSGTVSNYDRSLGSSCIAEKRMLETLSEGKAITPFMKAGDEIKIDLLDEKGQSIFGSIKQKVVRMKEVKAC